MSDDTLVGFLTTAYIILPGGLYAVGRADAALLFAFIVPGAVYLGRVSADGGQQR